MMVWYGRFAGANTLGCDGGARAKPLPRFCSTKPVPAGIMPEPKPPKRELRGRQWVGGRGGEGDRDLMKLHPLPQRSVTEKYTVSQELSAGEPCCSAVLVRAGSNDSERAAR